MSPNTITPGSSSSIINRTADDIKIYPLQNPRTQDVFQSIVKGRKSWKTLRGGEVVWPPELEAALIEGLESYQPDDSRETRLLGRFPMRNRFISDYIYQKTGKRRTAKQVGSRLQQLRDTCGGKRLLNLINPCRRPYRTPVPVSPQIHPLSSPSSYSSPPSLRYDSESSSDSSSPSSPTTPEAQVALQNLLYRGFDDKPEQPPQTVVYIDLLPEAAPGSQACEMMHSEAYQYPTSDYLNDGSMIMRASQTPRRLRDINPTITLLSQSETSARSYFTICSGDNVVFSEVTSLTPLGPAPDNPGNFLYSTSLVPGFWDKLIQLNDPTQYTIVQRVVQESSTGIPPALMFSATYKFSYPMSPSNTYAAPIPHRPIKVVQPIANPPIDFSMDCLLSLDPDGFADLLDYEKASTYNDLESYFGAGGDWDVRSFASSASSRSPTSGQLTPCSEISTDDMLLSPTSTCFSGQDISSYVV